MSSVLSDESEGIISVGFTDIVNVGGGRRVMDGDGTANDVQLECYSPRVTLKLEVGYPGAWFFLRLQLVGLF